MDVIHLSRCTFNLMGGTSLENVRLIKVTNIFQETSRHLDNLNGNLASSVLSKNLSVSE